MPIVDSGALEVEILRTDRAIYLYQPSLMQLFAVSNNSQELCTPLLPGKQEHEEASERGRATVNIVKGCNLHCVYCAYGETDRPLERMSLQTAVDVATWLFDYFQGRVDKVRLSFTSQGEPSHNIAAVRAIQSQIGKLLGTSNSPAFSYNFATNGVAISENALLELTQDPTMAIYFSIDGPPEVHNAIRGSKGQGNPYAMLMHRLESYKLSYRNYGKSLVSSTVLTALDVRFDQIFTHLEELGFESMVFRPIRGSKQQPLGLNARSLPVFVQGYDSLIDHLERRAIAGDLSGLRLVLNPYDCFGRLLYALLGGEERRQGCPGCMPGQGDPAHHSLVFDVNGDVYFPCRDFVCFNEYCIGNIYGTVDIAKLRHTMGRLDIGTRPGCCTCWASALCGGGCYNAAFLSSRQMVIPDDDLCELIRHLTMRALQLLVRLHERQPDQLRVLVKSRLPN